MTAPAETVRTFMAVVARKDYKSALPLIADTCDYDNGPLGKVEGPEGVRAVLEPFFAPTIENEFVVRREVTQGNVVVLERLDRHLLETGWVELPVTGVFEVQDGKITSWHDYFDVDTIMSKWPAA